MFTPEQLRVLSIGYDLDCGGYEFERAPKALDPEGDDVVIFDDPDLDYLGLQDVVRMGDYSCGLFAFAPGDGSFEFPESYEEQDYGTMVRVASGVLHDSDHECHCHGRLVTWTGAAGEPREALSGEKVAEYIRAGVEVENPPNFERLMFEHTGNTSGHAFPDCDRCGGDGQVESPGGAWAIYALKEG